VLDDFVAVSRGAEPSGARQRLDRGRASPARGPTFVAASGWVSCCGTTTAAWAWVSLRTLRAHRKL